LITVDNLKKVLEELHYVATKDKNIYIKEYIDFNCVIKVDFKNKTITYPKEQGMIIHRETTCNFSEPENFVVLECITSLLDKKYKPEHIELEKPMPGGHDDTGGYCDIQVKDNDGRTFILIECKKADVFENFWKKTLHDGDQLFRYFNSYRQAQALCLYTSDYSEEGKLKRTTHIISMCDNDEYLKTDKTLYSFKQVQAENGGKEEYFKVWKETYRQDYATQGIFEEDIETYTVGKSKYSVKDLIEVDNDTIQKKYHEFATILRQHNVGSHENAFDKLVNIFLAKIVDEVINPNELQFYWKGAAYDDYFSLQDRLQKLYKEGMEKYLGEEVTYIDQKEVSDAFHLFKSDPDATKNKIMEYFRKLKFYTNNDFAFLDVHNEELFYQNANILKKIVKMLEDIKFKTEEQNQFLGDLFEGFLDDGVKQSEGQFFTPLPIVKFLISSLPLESIVKNSSDIPKAIDYACGAGHFLTEYAACIKGIVEKEGKRNVAEYFEKIYGVEKEYRLSKVAKVSAFMYGEPDIQIIYGDALELNDKVQDGQFSVLAANPPYSVKGFLETLSNQSREMYTLTQYVANPAKNNSIEVFFVERAKQLLAGGGVAAIILPISVLTNQNIYITCREIILKYFDIVAISEFGKLTFGKTGTNTIAMFLRRKGQNPDISEHLTNRVDAWFKGDQTKDVVFQDEEQIGLYCDHCNINTGEYVGWLQGGNLPSASIFAEYQEKAKASARYNAIQKKKIMQNYSVEDRNNELLNYVNLWIKNLEKDKLFYFMLAKQNPCRVIVVKCPTDGKDEKASKKEKAFLGYEWSGAKGSEGIKYLNAVAEEDDSINKNKGIHSIKTPLFNPLNYSDADKINTLIKKNYNNETINIPDCLSGFVRLNSLVDMLDFSKTDFDKAIKTNSLTSEIKKGKYIYPVNTLKNMLVNVKGNKTKISAADIKEKGSVPVITQAGGELISGYCNSDAVIDELPLIVFGDHSCTFKYIDFRFVRGADGTQLIKTDENKCKAKYLYYYLSQQQVYNSDKYERHFKYLKEMQIPLPDTSIQDEIISKCEEQDKICADAEQSIKRLRAKENKELSSVSAETVQLGSVTLYVNEKAAYVDIRPESYITTDNMLQNCEGWIPYSSTPNIDRVTAYQKGDILVSNIRPYLKKICYAQTDGGCSPDVLVFRVLDPKIVFSEYLFFQMKKDEFFDNAMSDVKGMKMPRGKKDTIASFKFVLPSLKEQKKIVNKIRKIEREIKMEKQKILSASEIKRKIMKDYLER